VGVQEVSEAAARRAVCGSAVEIDCLDYGKDVVEIPRGYRHYCGRA